MTFSGCSSRLAVFASFSGQGGVERMIVNLCNGIAAAGYPLDLVLVKDRSECLQDLSSGVRVVRLGTGHTLASVFALSSYLRRERPLALLAAKDRAGRTAILARRLSRVPLRIVFRLGTTLSAALEDKPSWRKWLWYAPMRVIYPKADAIVAVSGGVADDLATITGLPREHFHVIPNPVITPRLVAQAEESCPHPWLEPGQPPVVLGIGRLTRQKDFPTLLHAFAEVRGTLDCRLIILGEGGDRSSLETLAHDLGIGDEVLLPGFVGNPYAWLSRASLFVLSSAWEGSPNALTEALALGVAVVATDCPSGPREILAEGRIAPLVEIGDVTAMAEAMRRMLATPPSLAELRQAAAAFTVEESSRRYLALMLGTR